MSKPWLIGAANWSPSGGGYTGYTGIWHDTADGIDWKSQVWSHLEVVAACVSQGLAAGHAW